MTNWTVITLILLIGLSVVAPTKLPVVLYKAGLVTLGGVLGYWIDRALFPYARPNRVMRTAQQWQSFVAPWSYLHACLA